MRNQKILPNLGLSVVCLIASALSGHANAAPSPLLIPMLAQFRCGWYVGTTGMSAVWIGAGSVVKLNLISPIEVEVLPVDDGETHPSYAKWGRIAANVVESEDSPWRFFQGIQLAGLVTLSRYGKPGYCEHVRVPEARVIVEKTLFSTGEGKLTIMTMQTDPANFTFPDLDYVSYECVKN